MSIERGESIVSEAGALPPRPDRGNPKSRAAIVRYWMKREATAGKVGPWGWIDWGEPCCWACGYFAASWRPHDSHKHQESDIANCWDSATGLERAHIVARSSHGLDHCGNLVLLCVKCHELSPDCGRAEVMYEWMRDCPRSDIGLHWTDAALINEGIKGILGDGPIPSQADIKSAVEWLQPASHLGRVSAATLLAIARKAAEYGREREGGDPT